MSLIPSPTHEALPPHWVGSSSPNMRVCVESCFILVWCVWFIYLAGLLFTEVKLTDSGSEGEGSWQVGGVLED